MNFYIVTFDRQPDVSYKEFHSDFIGHPEIKRRWHYIKSCYIIGTDLELGAIADHFAAVAKKHDIPITHLVMKVDPSKRQGRLVKDAWEWFRGDVRVQSGATPDTEVGQVLSEIYKLLNEGREGTNPEESA
jgi:hypothetical protein